MLWADFVVDGDRAFFSGSLAGGKTNSWARVQPGELTIGKHSVGEDIGYGGGRDGVD